ncbi:UNVERIFIED_CONTAM: pimeloyl-ACP methyl ester carboxylesterase [Williamsia faeni]
MRMTRFRSIAAAALVTISALSIGAGAGAASATERPTVVLVHGAFADATSWDGVASDLRSRGYRVVVPDIALRGPAHDADEVDRVVSSIPGPVILVGHSYGGVVVTNVHATNVAALVYVAAFIPDQGEPAMLALNPIQYPGSQLLPPVLQVKTVDDPTAPFGKNVDGYISRESFHSVFAQDVSDATAETMYAHQKSQALSANLEPTGVPLWKTTPSWALVPYDDRVIPRSSELAMAQRASAHITSVPGSHAVLVSQPHAVANLVALADAGS